MDEALCGNQPLSVMSVPNVEAQGHLAWHDVRGPWLHGELSHRRDQSFLESGMDIHYVDELGSRHQGVSTEVHWSGSRVSCLPRKRHLKTRLARDRRHNAQ